MSNGFHAGEARGPQQRAQPQQPAQPQQGAQPATEQPPADNNNQVEGEDAGREELNAAVAAAAQAGVAQALQEAQGMEQEFDRVDGGAARQGRNGMRTVLIMTPRKCCIFMLLNYCICYFCTGPVDQHLAALGVQMPAQQQQQRSPATPGVAATFGSSGAGSGTGVADAMDFATGMHRMIPLTACNASQMMLSNVERLN